MESIPAIYITEKFYYSKTNTEQHFDKAETYNICLCLYYIMQETGK